MGRRKNTKEKGSQFERHTCKRLSLWWSYEEDDDLFWRSQTSGGRATSRAKQNKRTLGQYGDVAAVDARGAQLIEACTIELKRGYNKHTIMDVIDRTDGHAAQEYDKFFDAALTSHELADSFAWLLIVQRDRRRPIIWMPTYFYDSIELRNCKQLTIQVETVVEVLRSDTKSGSYYEQVEVAGLLFTEFLEVATPSQIVNVLN